MDITTTNTGISYSHNFLWSLSKSLARPGLSPPLPHGRSSSPRVEGVPQVRRWLRRALDQRNSTTLKIAGEIVRQQADFLIHGLSALKPLALKDIAEAVGMHESTVSRVTSGLLMATPKGCYPLKSLFSVSLVTDEGDAKAAAAVRNMIQAIIADEPAGKPLSDDAIAMIVSERGVKLARRTVAKYRDMLKIPSSSERRRRARLAIAG